MMRPKQHLLPTTMWALVFFGPEQYVLYPTFCETRAEAANTKRLKGMKGWRIVKVKVSEAR